MADLPITPEAQEQRGQTPRATAYSYVRFSTAKQELGDSLRRQVEMARRYAAEHQLRLAETSFQDLGVSGFKGKNAQAGALAAFMGAVKSGVVAPGSFLLIEQFDRLSRDQVTKALRLLLDLVENDITVVTMVDGKVWNRETVQDVTNVLTSVILMSRAHEESKAKSARLTEVWEQKKLNAGVVGGRIVTSECPRWLRPKADKSGFEVIQDRVDSVRKVFEMRINGHGIVGIVSRANDERWPVPGKPPVRKPGEDAETFKQRSATEMTWHTSTVGRLLRNRAVLGEYQPHKNGEDGERLPVGDAVVGYYPAILDETTFLRAQAKAERSGRFPGRRDASLKNWLQGLLKCTCGHSFVRKNKDSQAQPGYARYYCTARNRKIRRADGTLCPGANAGQLENAVLAVVSSVAPQYFQGTARMDELRSRADVLEVEVSVAKSTRDRFVEAIGSSKAPVAALVQALTAAEHTLHDKERELATVRAEIADLSGDFESVFENIVKAVKAVDSLDARAALREDLSRVIEKVVVHQDDGYIKVHLRGNDVPVVQPLHELAFPPGIEIRQVPRPAPAGEHE